MTHWLLLKKVLHSFLQNTQHTHTHIHTHRQAIKGGNKENMEITVSGMRFICEHTFSVAISDHQVPVQGAR